MQAPQISLFLTITDQKSSGVTPMYFKGLIDHDIIIGDENGLGLKGTGNMSEDSLSKITQSQIQESRMTPVCFVCEKGLWLSLKVSKIISKYSAKSEITQTHES